MLTTFYSILHFLVDGICAVAMFGRFVHQPGGYLSILLYNFCAFALQMPFGAVLDILCKKEKDLGDLTLQKKAFAFALAGSMLTVIGAFTSPVILGIGNGLFHVGGGVGTIGEDREKKSAGRRLGVFVAPGAMGLYLGRLVSESGVGGRTWLIGSVLLMAAFFFLIQVCLTAMEEKTASGIAIRTPAPVSKSTSREGAKIDLLILAGCFLVVILRSFVGMQVSFPWRTTAAIGTLATAAVVLGKMLGGFCSPVLGRTKTVVLTLLLSAVCYALSDKMLLGLLALLLFNMTMPITLQILVDRHKALPGTMFGLLTVALFVGFLPTYFSWSLPVSGNWIGILGSLLSLVILAGVSLLAEKRPENE